MARPVRDRRMIPTAGIGPVYFDVVGIDVGLKRSFVGATLKRSRKSIKQFASR
jgi:hypothetical protein